MYYHKEEDVEQIQPIVITGTDKLTIIDKEDLNRLLRQYKINLPNL